MNKILKKVCLFLSVVIVLFSFPLSNVIFAGDSECPITANQENFLRYLNIILESRPDYGKKLTRGELAHITAKIANAEYTSDTVYFYDVPADHTYFNEICVLAQMGVLHGDGNGYFNPNDEVTYEAACKVFSVILGYGEIGQLDSYVRAARVAGVTDGVAATPIVNYGQAIRMAYNTLHCEMFEGVIYGNDITYKTQEGYLAVERYHGLVFQKGIVNGFYGTTLDHPSSIGEEEILINNIDYVSGEGEELLGKAVVFYSKRDKALDRPAKEIDFIYADEEKNNIIIINADDVVGKSGNSFKYYSNDKEKSASISTRDTDVVINGVAYPDYADADLIPSAGSVTLIDNDNDKVYDVIIVESYTYMVVKGADSDKKLIYGKYPDIIVGDANRDDVMFEVYTEGKKINPKTLSEGMVLAVRKSLNTAGMQKLRFYNLGDGHLGTVSSMSSKNITVDGTTYKKSSAFVFDEPVKLGDYVVIYEHLGEAAVAIHPENDVYKVGYLIDAADIGDTFESAFAVQLVDTDRNTRTFEAGKTINIDGTPYKDAEDAITALKNSASATYETSTSNWPMSQLVKYKLNNDGLITHIDTSYYDSSRETDNSLKLSSAVDLSYTRKYCDKNRGFYNNTTGKFEFSVNTGTSTIWGIPSLYRDEPENYYTWLDDNVAYKVEAYNIDPDSKIADYVVYYATKLTNVSDAAEPYIVVNVETVLDDEGTARKMITAYGTAKEATTYVVSESCSDVDVAVGDVIRMRQTIKGTEIVALEVLFSPDEIPETRAKEAGNTNTIDYKRQTRILYGTALYVEGNFLRHTTSLPEDVDGINVDAPENDNIYLGSGSTRYYVFDTDARIPEVKRGSINDIVTYSVSKNDPDKVMVYTYYGALNIVYIIK